MDKETRWLLLAFVLVGAGLRIWQYLGNIALYLDEVAIARNVLDRSVWDLLAKPLAFDQVAPKGFLVAEKIATLLFGPSEYALRLFPLASSILALILFWRIVERMLDGLGGAVALALFAVAGPFVSYAAQAKQYSSDVAIALFLLLLALDLSRPDLSSRRALAIGLAGAAAVWFSHPGILVACGVGGALFLLAVTDRQPARNARLLALAVPLGLWFASALTSAIVERATVASTTLEYMHRFWAVGFPPPIARALRVLWPWPGLRTLAGAGEPASLVYSAPRLFLMTALIGYLVLWRRGRKTAVLIASPFVVTLAAAIAHQYPFRDRLILFLVPGLFLGIGAAAGQICAWLAPRSKVLGVAVFLAVVGPAVYQMAKTPPVYHLEDMKPVLVYLQAQRRPGDRIYVYHGAGPVVNFYASAYGLRESEFAMGGCHRGDSRRYYEELDHFRGHSRVWLLMTQASPRYREQQDILGYLDSIGIRMDRFTVPAYLFGNQPGAAAEAFLYDLSDPQRLAQATAAAAPVTGPDSVTGRTGCSNGPQTMAPARGLDQQ